MIWRDIKSQSILIYTIWLNNCLRFPVFSQLKSFSFFQQAYKLVNEEKKKSAELKIRIEELENENTALKSTVKAHKRPTFSHRVLSPTSMITPVKLSKTPFRRLLNRYSNPNSHIGASKGFKNHFLLNTALDNRIEQVVYMEPLLSEDEPSGEKMLSEQHVKPSLSPSVKALLSEINESTQTADIEQLKTNQTKVSILIDLCNKQQF